MQTGQTYTSTLRDYLNVLRRRRVVVLLAVVVVPAGAVSLSMLQPARYSACANVLLSRQSLANSLSNVADPIYTIDPQRLVDTQMNVAQSPQIASAVLAAAHAKHRTPKQFLDSSSVSAKADTDVLVFCDSEGTAAAASQLATLYAKQYIVYANELSTRAIKSARQEVEAKLATLESPGRSCTASAPTCCPRTSSSPRTRRSRRATPR